MLMYDNPIKKKGDFADPFVLRYNGKYYMYCTNPDIRCWSSTDLVNWTAEGSTITEDTFPGLVPFAPEVTYWNGSFYMYTSPSGFGHYVLKSDSPTGPFKKISENVGQNIDGSVLIDDDGQWYFYWAHDDGIMGCQMSSPSLFGTPVNTGAYLHGWTEGPTVIKCNGKYYMTYTGNHYLSDGYRVNAAVSDAPLGPYKDCTNNPILVHTTGKNIGLGHNSIALAPDLNSHYLVYHNMNPDLTRDLNIDAVKFESGEVNVAGPTRTNHPAPRLPLYYCHPEKCENNFWNVEKGTWRRTNSWWISEGGEFKASFTKRLPQWGTIECNIGASASCFGLIAAGCKIELSNSHNLLKFNHELSCEEIEISLGNDFNFEVLHCIRLRYSKDGIELFLDNRRVLVKNRVLSVDKGLYCYSADGVFRLGCTVVSELVREEDAIVFPIPCTISSSCAFSLYVPYTDVYRMTVFSEANVLWEQITLCDEANLSAAAALTGSNSNMAEYEIKLTAGVHKMNMLLPEDSSKIKAISFTELPQEADNLISHIHLNRDAQKGVVEMPECENVFAQMSFPLAELTGESELAMIFRASELSLGGEGNDELLGIDFFIGYSIAVNNDNLILSKHQYDRQKLVSIPVSFADEIEQQLFVKCSMNQIQVFVGKDRVPVINYYDLHPILTGKIGYRSLKCKGSDIVLEIIKEDTND